MKRQVVSKAIEVGAIALKRLAQGSLEHGQIRCHRLLLMRICNKRLMKCLRPRHQLNL